MRRTDTPAHLFECIVGLVLDDLRYGNSPAMPSTHLDGLANEPETWDEAWTEDTFEQVGPYVNALDDIVSVLRPD